MAYGRYIADNTHGKPYTYYQPTLLLKIILLTLYITKQKPYVKQEINFVLLA